MALGANEFSVFPEELCSLKGLEVLDLSKNEIASIPPCIANMKNLKTLYCSTNKLESLPDALFDMPSLETVLFDENPIKEYDVRRLQSRFPELMAEPAKVYFDSFGNRTTSEHSSSYGYVMRDSLSLTRFVRKEYYLGSDQLQSVGTVSSPSGKKYEGPATRYYDNGSLMSRGMMKNNARSGQWELWYRNGKPMETLDYEENRQIPRVINYWDSLGNQFVENGDGIYTRDEDEPFAYSRGEVHSGMPDGEWMGYYADGSLGFTERYSKGEFVRGVGYDRDGNGHPYDAISDFGDLNPFYDFVAKHLRYPPMARKLNIEGRLFVQMVIDAEGKIVSATVIRGLGSGLDEEALRVVRSFPGKFDQLDRGLPPQEQKRLVLPLQFKIN